MPLTEMTTPGQGGGEGGYETLEYVEAPTLLSTYTKSGLTVGDKLMFLAWDATSAAVTADSMRITSATGCNYEYISNLLESIYTAASLKFYGACYVLDVTNTSITVNLSRGTTGILVLKFV